MARGNSSIVEDVKILMLKGEKGDGVSDVQKAISDLKAEVEEMTEDARDDIKASMARVDMLLTSGSLTGYTLKTYEFDVGNDDWFNFDSPVDTNYDVVIEDLPVGYIFVECLAGLKRVDYTYKTGQLVNIEMTQTTFSGRIYWRDLFFPNSAEYPDNWRDYADLDKLAKFYVIFAVPVASDDSEVRDIRIGADGTVYDSAGDAVRGQVDKLQDELDDIAKIPAGGKAGQVLASDGSGGLSWVTIDTADAIVDGDEVSY